MGGRRVLAADGDERVLCGRVGLVLGEVGLGGDEWGVGRGGGREGEGRVWRRGLIELERERERWT